MSYLPRDEIHTAAVRRHRSRSMGGDPVRMEHLAPFFSDGPSSG